MIARHSTRGWLQWMQKTWLCLFYVVISKVDPENEGPTALGADGFRRYLSIK